MHTMNHEDLRLLSHPACLAAALLLGLAACGDSGGGTQDAATDATVDATDAGGDAQAPTDAATQDASTVVRPDGGPADCSQVTCDTECAVYVDRSLDTPGEGATPETALDTVQAGVDAAAGLAGACCTCAVRVAEGRYRIFRSGPSDTLLLRERVSVYGGYPRGFGEARDPARYRTTLDGQEPDDGTGHVHHVVTGADAARLDGFTITGGRGRADANPFNPDNYGGGLIALGTAPTVAACVFQGNEAVYGGGAYTTHSAATFEQCRFVENVADRSGGGLSVHDSGALTLSRCDLRQNHAAAGGGLHLGPGSDAQVRNTTFWQNTATAEGGGVHIDHAAPALVNTSFNANTAAAGGAIYAMGGAHPVVTNSVLWGDAPDEIDHDTGSDLAVTYSDVQGGCTTAAGCTTDETGNMTQDPLYLDAGRGDLRLWVTSPVVDQGDDAAASALPTDQEGDGRILDGDDDSQAVVDMGADELAWTLQTMPILYVDQAASGAGDGTSWTNAYTSLHAAFAAASAFHQIWVATGTYTPSDLGDKTASLQVPAGVFVFGGFDPAHGISNMALRDPATYETVLSGDIMGDDALGSTLNNSQHVVTSGHHSELDGFTVTAGYNRAMVSGGDGRGACLVVDPGHFFTVRSCRFTGCEANVGGALHAGEGSVLTLVGCDFVDNLASGGGAAGAVMLNHPALGTTVTGCTFDGNQAYNGGGLRIYGGQGVTVDGCTFTGNTASAATEGGGGLLAEATADLLVTGCSFTGNTATVGGGVSLRDCTGTRVEASTLDANQVSGSGGVPCDASYSFMRGVGGGLLLDGGDVRISGSTFSGNTATVSGNGSCNNPTYRYFFGVGGGVFARDSALDILGSTFTGNQARLTGTGCLAGAGGGVGAYQATVRVVNTVFWSNAASIGHAALNTCTGGGGGGFWSYYDPADQLASCAFAKNTANNGGAGLFFAHSTSHLYGVSATANSGSYYGSGLYLDSGTLTTFNSIFWGNSATSLSYPQVALGPGGGCQAWRALHTYYTDIYNTSGGNGCLPNCSVNPYICSSPRHFDPGFVNPGATPPDLHLVSGGAGVNAGSNSAPYLADDWLDVDGDGDTSEALPLDPDGNPRTTGTMDLGAFERP